MHHRQLIRQTVVALLSGATAAGTRVFPSRARTLGRDELPALRVYTPAEVGDGAVLLNGQTSGSRVQLNVEILAAARDGVEDVIDDICEDAEAALDASESLAARWRNTTIDYEDEDQVVMQAVVSFEVFISRN